MLVRGHRISVTQRNKPGKSDLESDGEHGYGIILHIEICSEGESCDLTS